MPSLFPTVPDTIPAQASSEIGRAPAFDNGRNLFLMRDGAVVERSGLEAVKQWISLMLCQQIDRVPIYRTGTDTPIGIDREILGSRLPSGLASAEIERNVRETMSYCPAIRAVQDIKVSRRGRACRVEFTAVLYDGNTVEVNQDV